ncbi:SDR family NAD(P)-dependent oxidoreductase [Sneathiella sp. P13V-1]|uniref:SDR family oxidoreductase n=1 Tax=Sneathiella sp. P13V-1 TaxID=2697366 RepID=UPI00187BC32B|nr:SDR family oxidoreductase [Sneathiella sp. P13V-1]MBE7637334.1 SDR family NAD(P)-dependent oxidoreductase [Sneathiella sp. P13V-1]
MTSTTVLITGANRGIGLELTRQYLEKTDYNVISTARNINNAHDLNNLKETHRERLQVLSLDVTSDTSASNLSLELKNTDIDILINNAGIMGGAHQEFRDMDYGDWAEVLATNSMSPMRITEALYENLKRSKGKVVTISSQMGAMGKEGAGRIAYRSSKSAVNKVMQCVAEDVRRDGISVMCVHPGWVQTDMGGSAADITAVESALGIRQIIEELTIEKSGCFMNWNGTEHVW